MSDWKSDQSNLPNDKKQNNTLNEEELEAIKDDVDRFFSEVVIPAFEELRNDLKRNQREVELAISLGDESCSIIVNYQGQIEYEYTMRVIINQGVPFPYPEIRYRESVDGKLYGGESILRGGTQDYNITHITKDEIVQHFLSGYKKQHYSFDRDM